MTSASQAGILHGTNDGIPAFRWYERDRQKLMVSSKPDDAAEIVRRLSNGEGLLSNNGVSICNLMTGDATRAYVTTGAIKDQAQGLGDSQAFLGFFFSPSGYLRSFTMFIAEFLKERIQARRTRRSGRPAPDAPRDEVRRHARRQQRAAAGRQHVADHRGDVPRRERDLRRLHRLRRARAPLRPGARRIVPGARRRRRGDRDHRQGRRGRARARTGSSILSDHGQSLGATFKQRYGQSLGEVVRGLMSGRATLVQTKTAGEGSTFVNSFLSEITRSKGVGPAVARAALAEQTHDGVVDLEQEELPPPADESTIAVVGSGNLGLVWFTGHDHRLTAEELEELHPNLVATLAAHPGVGMLMVRSSERGAVVFGPSGVRYLDEDRVEGEDPTTLFGAHTVMSLKREDAMLHAPDLLLLSQYDPVMGEVAAFEELIGSHGGLGGFQTRAVHPPSRASGSSTSRSRSGPRRSTAISGAGCGRSGSSLAGRHRWRPRRPQRRRRSPRPSPRRPSPGWLRRIGSPEGDAPIPVAGGRPSAGHGSRFMSDPGSARNAVYLIVVADDRPSSWSAAGSSGWSTAGVRAA